MKLISHRPYQNLNIIVLAIGLTFLIISCKKESEPELAIKDKGIELTKDEPEQSLLIANIGEGTLNWSIENLPDWVSVSRNSGSLEPGPDEIIFTGQLSYNTGNYQSNVAISSNGGNKTIVVNFELTRQEFSILPGQGITDVLLGNTFNSVKNEIGLPDTVFHYQYDNQGANFVHESVYQNLGLVMFYINNNPAIVNNSDPLIFIQCISTAFKGTTGEGIGIGSTLNQIESAYGTPTDTISGQGGNFSYEFFAYAETGIGFYFFDSNYSRCEVIEIFPASSSPVRKNHEGEKIIHPFYNRNLNVIPKR